MAEDEEVAETQPRGYWRSFIEHHRYTLPVEVFFALVIGGALVAVQVIADNNRERLAQEQAEASAQRQEVLSNTLFLRETLRDAPGGAKDFRGLNLRGADLAGLDFGCDVQFAPPTAVPGAPEAGSLLSPPVDPRACADFTGADLRDVDFTGADLTGADLRGADLRGASLARVLAVGARFRGGDHSLDGLDVTHADLRTAEISGFWEGAPRTDGDVEVSIEGSRADGIEVSLAGRLAAGGTSLRGAVLRLDDVSCEAGSFAGLRGCGDAEVVGVQVSPHILDAEAMETYYASIESDVYE